MTRSGTPSGTTRCSTCTGSEDETFWASSDSAANTNRTHKEAATRPRFLPEIIQFPSYYSSFTRARRDVAFAREDAKALAIFSGGDHFDVTERPIVSPVFRYVADGVLVANAAGDFEP